MTETRPFRRRIALVAHDNCKKELVQWVRENASALQGQDLTCTGTTGRLVEKALQEKLGEAFAECRLQKLKSGPLGGDLQMGALIAEGQIDVLIFFWDPMQAQPHDVDVKALLRISNLYNVPTACNVATANHIISSPLYAEEHHAKATYNFSEYTERPLS